MSSSFRTYLGLALIFALTLATRIAYYAPDPHPNTGPWLYGALAHNIVSDGHWFQVNANAGPNFAFNAPSRLAGPVVAPAEANLRYADAHPRWEPFIAEPVGEAVPLAGLWELTGSQTYTADVLMKIVLDAFAALLVYRIAIMLFKRRRAALAAGLMYALYPPIAEVVINPSRDFWGMDLTIVILALYLETINSKRPGRWLVALGVVTGISLYFDASLIVLPGALALTSLAVANWRTVLRRALIPTAIALLLLVPWTIRNYDDFHAFIFVRTSLGTTLWEGLAELPSSYGPKRGDYANYQLVGRALGNVHWETPKYDSYLAHRALSVIERHPFFYLKTVAHRVWVSTLGELDPEWMSKGTTTPFAYSAGPFAFVIAHPFQLLQLALMPLVFLLAMLSLGLTWARYKHVHLILIALAVSIAVPYLIIHVESRYMMPMTISYLLWIGLGSDLLLERVRVWRRARLLMA
jgi:4-amino-4-deoxy-L-arabinose transferase-like glycosyltransferase